MVHFCTTQALNYNWNVLQFYIYQFRSRMRAELQKNQLALSGAACHDLLKVKDGIEGVLSLVLPPQWGRIDALQAGDVADNNDDIFYDHSLIFELIPLLEDLASYSIYDNEVDAILLDVIYYFNDELQIM